MPEVDDEKSSHSIGFLCKSWEQQKKQHHADRPRTMWFNLNDRSGRWKNSKMSLFFFCVKVENIRKNNTMRTRPRTMWLKKKGKKLREKKTSCGPRKKVPKRGVGHPGRKIWFFTKELQKELQTKKSGVFSQISWSSHPVREASCGPGLILCDWR